MTRLCLGTWAGRDLSTPFEFRGWPFCPKDLISSVALDQNWWGSSPNVRRLHSQAVSYVFSSVAADVAAVGVFFFFFPMSSVLLTCRRSLVDTGLVVLKAGARLGDLPLLFR